jgi:hypothetical protein
MALPPRTGRYWRFIHDANIMGFGMWYVWYSSFIYNLWFIKDGVRIVPTIAYGGTNMGSVVNIWNCTDDSESTFAELYSNYYNYYSYPSRVVFLFGFPESITPEYMQLYMSYCPPAFLVQYSDNPLVLDYPFNSAYDYLWTTAYTGRDGRDGFNTTEVHNVWFRLQPLHVIQEITSGIKMPDNQIVLNSAILNIWSTEAPPVNSAIEGIIHTDMPGTLRIAGKSDDLSVVSLGIPESSVLGGMQGIARVAVPNMGSALKAGARLEVDVSSALKTILNLTQPAGVYGKEGNTLRAGIIGGKPQSFGIAYPLSSLIPLRTSNVWGSGFKTVSTLSVGYGTVTVTPVQYDKFGYEFFVLDHAMQGIDQVLVDDKEEHNFSFTNKVDSEGRAIALITFVNAMTGKEVISVTGRGKMHPKYGHLLINPADVLWDFLSNVCNLPILSEDVERFRTECSNAGIDLNGVINDNSKTIRSQIDEMMMSVGGVWSGGMPGIARIYPL